MSEEYTPQDRGQATRSAIKRLIVSSLNLDGLSPERITDSEHLFGDGLGLDSVDALELVVAMEKEFGISIRSHEIDRRVFSSVSDLAAFVEKCRSEPDRSEPARLPNG
jgi:acyl carrier protein